MCVSERAESLTPETWEKLFLAARYKLQLLETRVK
jgi:hypothetical protein